MVSIGRPDGDEPNVKINIEEEEPVFEVCEVCEETHEIEEEVIKFEKFEEGDGIPSVRLEKKLSEGKDNIIEHLQKNPRVVDYSKLNCKKSILDSKEGKLQFKLYQQNEDWSLEKDPAKFDPKKPVKLYIPVSWEIDYDNESLEPYRHNILTNIELPKDGSPQQIQEALQKATIHAKVFKQLFKTPLTGSAGKKIGFEFFKGNCFAMSPPDPKQMKNIYRVSTTDQKQTVSINLKELKTEEGVGDWTGEIDPNQLESEGYKAVQEHLKLQQEFDSVLKGGVSAVAALNDPDLMKYLQFSAVEMQSDQDQIEAAQLFFTDRVGRPRFKKVLLKLFEFAGGLDKEGRPSFEPDQYGGYPITPTLATNIKRKFQLFAAGAYSLIKGSDSYEKYENYKNRVYGAADYETQGDLEPVLTRDAKKARKGSFGFAESGKRIDKLESEAFARLEKAKNKLDKANENGIQEKIDEAHLFYRYAYARAENAVNIRQEHLNLASAGYLSLDTGKETFNLRSNQLNFLKFRSIVKHLKAVQISDISQDTKDQEFLTELAKIDENDIEAVFAKYDGEQLQRLDLFYQDPLITKNFSEVDYTVMRLSSQIELMTGNLSDKAIDAELKIVKLEEQLKAGKERLERFSFKNDTDDEVTIEEIE